MSPIRIAHVITDLNRGGAELMLSRLLPRMDRVRFENHVITLMSPGAAADPIREAGIPISSLELERGRAKLSALRQCVRLLRGLRPDILQSWLYHADLLALVAGRWAGAGPLVWNVRNSNLDMSQYSRSSALVRWVLARCSALVDVTIVNSTAGRESHERIGYRPKRWALIPNGLDLEVFQPERDARARLCTGLNIPESSILIGLVARYDPMKDHQNFLEAARILHGQHADARFVLVGRGMEPANDVLREQISSFAPSVPIHLLGERGDVQHIVAGLDIATLTSAFGEGFPNVVAEAMACEVPCVVTDVGDAGEIVGDTGKVVPIRDAEALARGWSFMVDLGVEGRARLGSAARHRISSQFDLTGIVRRYEELYSTLASPSPDSKPPSAQLARQPSDLTAPADAKDCGRS